MIIYERYQARIRCVNGPIKLLYPSICITIPRAERRIRFSLGAAELNRFPFLETCLQIVCLDLEGVLTPEIWIEFSARTGIAELSKTTRDEPDYDKLMRGRIEILDREGLGLSDIQTVIAEMRPLDGAREFLDWLRGICQVVILSDTYYEFAAPLMRQLGYPTLFCHDLLVNADGRVRDYRLRMRDQKRESVKAFRSLQFCTVAVGDSYNDTSMLAEAHTGILFRPPASVIAEFPQYPVAQSYDELRAEIVNARPKG